MRKGGYKYFNKQTLIGCFTGIPIVQEKEEKASSTDFWGND